MACKCHKEHAELQRTCPSVSSVFKQKETPLSVSSLFKQKEKTPSVSSLFKQKETPPSVSSLFKQKETQLMLKTTRVEAFLVTTLGDSNLPLSAADKLMQTLKMFLDSEIAHGLQCGRSKATAMLQELAADSKMTLAQRMKNGPFTVSTDGSNDAGSKLFLIVVRTVDKTSAVRSDVLSVPQCEGPATGRNIFNLIADEFEKHKIPWDSCI